MEFLLNLPMWSHYLIIAIVGIALLNMPNVFKRHEDFAKYGSKKFLVAIGLLICVTYMAVIGRIDGLAITIIFGMVGSGYTYANYKSHMDFNEHDDTVSRKFIITTATFAITMALTTMDETLLSSNNLMGIMTSVGGTYGFVNVKQHKSKT